MTWPAESKVKDERSWLKDKWMKRKQVKELNSMCSIPGLETKVELVTYQNSTVTVMSSSME